MVVWAALCSASIIGPFFFESYGEVRTVKSDSCMNLHETKFLPALHRRGISNNIWFRQEGATTHIAGKIIDWFKTNIWRTAYFSIKSRIWPPHSSDLSQLDFFLWEFVKD